jgi:DNA-3-methyladenine glycosylase II
MQEIILERLRRDAQLRPLIEVIPFPQPPSSDRDLFEDLLRSIAGQQLSVKAAQRIFDRFKALFPGEKPQAAPLLAFSDDELRGIGLSKQKSDYVRNVAAFFLEHQLSDQDWSVHSDEAIIASLTRIKGVGVWTVQMILMFSLGRPDVFPTADFGIQTAMRSLYGLEAEGKAMHRAMAEISDIWRPFRSYACYYLWRWKDGG